MKQDIKILSPYIYSESSTITYAHAHQHIVVSDDRAARQHCTNINLPVTGTIGILQACVQDQTLQLEEADSILAKMINKGFYSPVKSISHIL